MTASVADLKDQFTNPTAAELELIARYAMLPEDARRTRAFEAFAKTGLPHRRLEAWKWTDFKAALKTVEASPSAPTAAPLSPPEGAVIIRFDAHGVTLPTVVPDGLVLHQQTATPALSDAESVPLGTLTAALAGHKGGMDTLAIEVTKPIHQPVFIECVSDRDETNFARVKIVIRDGAAIDLVESHVGGAGFSSYLTEIAMAEKSVSRRTVLQRGRQDEAAAITALVTLGAAAEYTQTVLAFGAKVARIETRLTHQETGSQAVLNGAYLCADGYHADLTSHVRHGAPSCVTRQVTKGAVLSGGTGVFQGKFHVPRTIGQHTDADMQHQALLLEEGAAVFAKPELEIYADDVECAHGNTSGALDENQLFYLRQRGIPLAQARAMLTEAFIAEALETASATTRDAMLAAAGDWLSAGA